MSHDMFYVVNFHVYFKEILHVPVFPLYSLDKKDLTFSVRTLQVLPFRWRVL